MSRKSRDDNMTLFLGFDGGGTKTACAVIDAAGRVLGEGAAGPSNPLRIGYEKAFSALRAAAEASLDGAHAEKEAIGSVCAALAGAGRRGVAEKVKQFLRSSFPSARAYVASDFEAALEAAAGAGPGVVLIAGTGSAAFGRNARGETLRAGGYGPWIGDEGSAFDIGRRAVAAVASASDRGDPEPFFAPRLLAAIHCADWNELIERAAEHADEVFPNLFPVIVEAAESGGDLARQLLQHAAIELGALAENVVRRLRLQEEEFVLAKSGGVFGRTRLLDEPLNSRLRAIAPQARIELLRKAPAVGAAQIALRFAAASRS